MHIQRKTAYALRTLLYMATHAGTLTQGEICDATDMPVNYFPKTVRVLKEAGFIRAQYGVYGGYRLSCKLDEINLLTIYELFETTYNEAECTLCNHKCRRHPADPCPIRETMKSIVAHAREQMHSMTLQELVDRDQLSITLNHSEPEPASSLS